MIECIQWWMVHHPELVRVWAVLAIVDITIFVLIPFLGSDEEQGIESASAVGVIVVEEP
ncbi:hypothetical protein GCM10010423_65580 [Streptomyces levis]|uniref:Uncharacterized protein n=1 Tax=Streptomyces levis TaxID=285566 RepID=A0ABN3P155_9ACTN